MFDRLYSCPTCGLVFLKVSKYEILHQQRKLKLKIVEALQARKAMFVLLTAKNQFVAQEQSTKHLSSA